MSAADVAFQRIVTRIRNSMPLGPATLLHLQTPRSDTLRFLAGQSVTLKLDGGPGIEVPIASCPCDARNLQFLLWNEKHLDFINAVNRFDESTITIEGPFGDFLLNEDSQAPAIFISVDAGLGPIKSLVEHVLATESAKSVQLYRIDQLTDASPMANLFRSWDDAFDHFGYERMSRAITYTDLVDRLRTNHQRLDETLFYIAAPESWLPGCLEAFKTELDIPMRNIHLHKA